MNANNSIKLSIVIPLYNLQDYITMCISSIYNQHVDDKFFEVIVVDDGSRDNSISYVEPFLDEHDNIRLFKQVNHGVSVARNHGLSCVSGEYVAFLDGDDTLQPNSISKIISYLDHCDSDIIYMRSKLNSLNAQDLHIWYKFFQKDTKYFARDLLKKGYNNCGSVTAGIYKVSFLRDNKIDFAPGVANSEDAIFNYLLYSYNPIVYFADIVFYSVTIREGSAHRNYTIKRAEGFRKNFSYLDKIAKDFDSHSMKAILDLAYYQTISQASNMCVKCGMNKSNEIRKVIGWDSPHKLRYKFFTIKQLWKVFMINNCYSIYIKLLQKRH